MVEAAGVVIAVEIGLAVTSLPRLARWCGVPLATDRDDPVLDVDNFAALEALTAREQRAHWAVDWFLERWLFDGTCLRRSLAFGWFIRARRPVLRLGMIDDGGKVAHAWVEAEGRAFDAVQVTGAFVVDRSTAGHAGSRAVGRKRVRQDEGQDFPPDRRLDLPEGA
jgi:Transglutaminase-like superfamily